MGLLNNAFVGLRGKLLSTYSFLLLANGAAWLWAALAFRHFPLLLGTAFLAYSFGLRHAVDADHIAAIDNVTRKLMQEGKRPVTVGLMFSLGHSTIVFVGSILLASTAQSLQHRVETFRNFGGLIGTTVSTLFLFGIALANLTALRGIYRVFARVRKGAPYIEEEMDLLLANQGLLARVLRPMFKLIRESWHMYPLGVLFGLGFDTATEIGLLSISATEATRGLPLLATLVFPTLFAAGMCLVDTTDNVLMLGAYGWAFVKPVRKLYYNLTITLVSIIVALVVGSVEALGLLVAHFRLNGSLWDLIRRLNENFGTLGYLIIAIFMVSWIGSITFYRLKRLDDSSVQA
ncbi:HoxN/HupN/NixA family nickel/cobalt transporter [Granulicella sp. WH15]|uniref:HoxN/HupN/NixA family nickel/cobalt transporter n=1 Tax=Granulicella sp. WH15 TaxID=2602070 RepID=UPI0013676897|nr:HoxN/HupN/NixA family nickel/cobalt transporter [Granulicella sp. WH15]QHN04702.1 HoxN/HupN/NixA family nickel/cobalt transporter [Granulicella sp. WH15]